MRKVGLILPLLLTSNVLMADMITYKSILKDNNSLFYKNTPLFAKNMNEVFLKGFFMGRLRTNLFEQITSDGESMGVMGTGAAITYRTARLNNFYLTGEIGYSDTLLKTFNNSDVSKIKSGKDVFSRNKVGQTGDYSMYSIPELNVTYKNGPYEIKYGMQGVNNAFMAENNTKMIKNSFLGTKVSYKGSQNLIDMYYLQSQKLRDHESYHDGIFYDGYEGNDDSGMHRGLNGSNGMSKNNEILVAEYLNKSIPNTQIKFSNLLVTDILNASIADIDYVMSFKSFNLIPGFRYYHQKDLGAGVIGGASISGMKGLEGYTDIDSVESSMYAGRVQLVFESGKLIFGYSKVDDKADLISPWRGFPTKGYTRSMAQLNWYANTETYMVQYKAKLADYGIAIFDYSKINFDETKVDNKGKPLADASVFHVDYIYNHIFGMKNLQLKTRYSFMDYEKNINQLDRTYQDIRTELNFLF